MGISWGTGISQEMGIRQFQTNHSFLIGRQDEINLNINYLSILCIMFIWSCVLVYRETRVYWDLVYKDERQYIENIQV